MDKFKKVFSKEFVVPYFIKLFYVLCFVLFLESIIVSVNYYDMKNRTIEKIDNIIESEGIDLNLICVVGDCIKIEYDGLRYSMQPDKDILVSRDPIEGFNNNCMFCSTPYYIDEVFEVTIYKDHTDFIKITLLQYLAIIFITIFIFSWYYIKSVISDENTNTLKLFVDKFKLEGKLQNVIAESAYHEMMTPVAAAKTSMYEINNIREGIIKSDNIGCDECNNKIANSYRKYESIIMDSLDRLESVLNQMSMSKHAKYSSDEKSLYQLIRSANNSLQIFHINSNFEYMINSEYIMKKWRVKNIPNGTMLNILNNQIKNALEAGSTKIVFDAKESGKKDKLHIIITDNGQGIENGTDDPESCEYIFKLGNSTKTEECIPVEIKKKWYDKWLEVIIGGDKTNNLDNFIDSKSYRGFGLYVSREILRSAGGDIKVLNTSKEGTVFMLTVSVKESN